MWTGCSIRYVSWNFSCFSYSGISLVIGDLTANASYKLKVGRQRTQAKLIIYQAAVKSVVENLRAKITHQIYIIGKCKFPMESQILNWTNRACFREELPLGSFGSKELATSESHLPKCSRLPTSKVCGLKSASRRHSHNFFIVKFCTVTGRLQQYKNNHSIKECFFKQVNVTKLPL
jgi:hypothetical protein